MYLPQNTRTRILVAARIKTRLGKIEEDYVDGEKRQGEGYRDWRRSGPTVAAPMGRAVPAAKPQNPFKHRKRDKRRSEQIQAKQKKPTRGWRPYRYSRAAASRPAIQLGAILPILSGPLCFLRTSTIKTFKSRIQSKAVRCRARAMISAAAAGERAPMSSRHPEDARSMESAAKTLGSR